MQTFLLTAPRLLGKIPTGFMIQVASCRTGTQPDAEEVEAAIRRAGFTDRDSLSYRSPGNWKVQKIG